MATVHISKLMNVNMKRQKNYIEFISVAATYNCGNFQYNLSD